MATFAHAMSRTIPTVASSTHSTCPTSPITSSASGLTLGPILMSSKTWRVKPGGAGNRSKASGIIRATSAFACAIVTPGFKRAIAW